MTAEIVERVRRSSRYRDVDGSLLARLAEEELPRARNADDAVKRVKRRLHQVVGAFRGSTAADPLARVRAAWTGDLAAPTFRDACAEVLAGHASTRERVPHLDTFYRDLWKQTGDPRRVLDLGCGFGPLAVPWMAIGDAELVATDVDRRSLDVVDAFLALVGQPHGTQPLDLVTQQPADEADVALLLKLVTTLDRQDPAAAARLLGGLRTRYAVVSFTSRSLGGRRKNMERTYRERFERLVAEVARVRGVAEASVPGELVFVVELDPVDG